ncbi:MAG: hypothetical protein LBU39_07195 [Desulfobulbaceae bacterium]|nr:hypothetical protein [Desulfobulbaceae bacterium]
MKQLLVIALIAVAVAAYMTNPQVEQHRDAAKFRVNELMQASMSQEAPPLVASIGAALGKTLAGPVLDNVVNSDNYYLFSTTTLTWNGINNVVGIGAFKKVFLLEKFDKVYKSAMGEGDKAAE